MKFTVKDKKKIIIGVLIPVLGFIALGVVKFMSVKAEKVIKGNDQIWINKSEITKLWKYVKRSRRK